MNHDTGVYLITSPSGKRYVGSAVSFKRRWYEHRRRLKNGDHDNAALQAAYAKYGPDGLVFSVLAYCMTIELRLIEQRFIDALKPEYNMAALADAPPLARDFTAATKAKMSAAHLGRKQSPELIAKRVAARAGYVHAKATRQKIGAAHAGRKATPEQIERNRMAPKLRGKDHPQFGKTISEEHRAILSRVHKGKTISEDIRRRTSETMMGMNAGAANPNARAVICLDTGMRYGSGSEALAWLRALGKTKASMAAISSSIRHPGRTAYGYRWAYAEKDAA